MRIEIIHKDKKTIELECELINYQCKEGCHVTSVNFNLRFRGNRGWKEFMPIIDMFAGVTNNRHFNTWGEIINNISNHPANHKGICTHLSHIMKRRKSGKRMSGNY